MHDLKDIIHIETDVLLYQDLENVMPVLQSYDFACVRDSDIRVIGSIIYIKDKKISKKISSIASEYINENDMVILHYIEKKMNNSLCLPIGDNDNYRNDSIIETQRVVDITRSLKKFFPKTKRPLIVANIGGFSMDKNIPSEEIDSYYERFAESMSKIDFEGVELIPQNMAPFPWHFGGQRYQNMLISAEEIVKCCKKLNLRICFDISHCMLACNHFGYDLYDFTENQIQEYEAIAQNRSR
jgi:hypothetical protein